jgi:hypothetical protein
MVMMGYGHDDNGIVSLYRNDPTPHIYIRLKIKPNSVRISMYHLHTLRHMSYVYL